MSVCLHTYLSIYQQAIYSSTYFQNVCETPQNKYFSQEQSTTAWDTYQVGSPAGNDFLSSYEQKPCNLFIPFLNLAQVWHTLDKNMNVWYT